MDKKIPSKPLAAAIGTTFAVTLAAVSPAQASENPFAVVEYQQGYMVAADQPEGKCGEGKCGGGDMKDEKKVRESADDKGGEGGCGGKDKGGEGKCGK